MSSSCLDDVRSSTEWVLEEAVSVNVDKNGIERVAASIDDAQLDAIKSHVFDAELHYVDGGPKTVQYLLVVDALNFCFWLDGELEYEDLAGGLKRAMEREPRAFEAVQLASITADGLSEMVGWKRPLPQLEERARLMREVGRGLLRQYGGQAANLVRSASGSAVRLVEAVTAAFPGFRDHAIYRGRQVFFYKRAQIFVGDIWGAFGGEGLGRFEDIDQVTMFADYRVPVVLRQMGILTYSPALADKVDTRQELMAGSEDEIEIRAATIQAVEAIRKQLASRQGYHDSWPPGTQHSVNVGAPLLAVHLDWWLWEKGEVERTSADPHHRVRTIFY
eukprot:jgi/Botrbrau1/23685/Bobra.55_2s0065.1